MHLASRCSTQPTHRISASSGRWQTGHFIHPAGLEPMAKACKWVASVQGPCANEQKLRIGFEKRCFGHQIDLDLVRYMQLSVDYRRPHPRVSHRRANDVPRHGHRCGHQRVVAGLSSLPGKVRGEVPAGKQTRECESESEKERGKASARARVRVTERSRIILCGDNPDELSAAGAGWERSTGHPQIAARAPKILWRVGLARVA